LIKGIRHTGIVVNDINKMVAFYKDILGMKKVLETIEEGKYIETIIGLHSIRLHIIKLLTPDNSMIELLKYEGVNNTVQRDNFLWRQGITHIAFTVDDIDRIYMTLKKYGIDFISEPILSTDNYAKVCFCRDPEGNFLELVEVMKKKK